MQAKEALAKDIERPIPRIIGRVVTKDDGFSWEVYVTTDAVKRIGSEELELGPNTLCLASPEAFTRASVAMQDMREHVKEINSVVLQAMGGDGTEGYLDLKTGMHVTPGVKI